MIVKQKSESKPNLEAQWRTLTTTGFFRGNSEVGKMLFGVII
jgi:hypothetical protein